MGVMMSDFRTVSALLLFVNSLKPGDLWTTVSSPGHKERLL